MKFVQCPECNGRQWNWSDHSPNAFREKCEVCNGWGEVVITKYLLANGWTNGLNGWVEFDVNTGTFYADENGTVDFIDANGNEVDQLKDASISDIETLLKNDL